MPRKTARNAASEEASAEHEDLPCFRALLPQHRRWVDEYFRSFIELGRYDNTWAAKEAGYSAKAAKQIGSTIRARPDVQAAIVERQLLVAARVDLNREWVVNALMTNAMACLTPGDTHNPAAANKALELLGKECQMFADRHELTGRNGGPIETKLDLTGLPDDDLQNLADILGRAAVAGGGEGGDRPEGEAAGD